MRLEGRTVVVTGASHGLGRAIALAAAEEGANVVLAARDEVALGRVAMVVQGLGREALVLPCDVREPADVARLAACTLAHYGRVDALVNAAGTVLPRLVTEIDWAEWDDSFATLVGGPLRVTQALLPTMVAQQHGNIINLVAPLERVIQPGLAPYAAATFALTGLTRALALELRAAGINVNGLNPGGFAASGTGRTLAGLAAARGDEELLLDPAVVTPAAIALAAQPPFGLSGDIVDAIAWNTDPGLGAGLG